MAPDSQRVMSVLGSTMAVATKQKGVNSVSPNHRHFKKQWPTWDSPVRVDIDERPLLHIIKLERMNLIRHFQLIQDGDNLPYCQETSSVRMRETDP